MRDVLINLILRLSPPEDQPTNDASREVEF